MALNGIYYACATEGRRPEDEVTSFVLEEGRDLFACQSSVLVTVVRSSGFLCKFVQQLKPLILESCLFDLSGDYCAFVLCCLCSAGDTTREFAAGVDSR